jgi:hypothetical protein
MVLIPDADRASVAVKIIFSSALCQVKNDLTGQKMFLYGAAETFIGECTANELSFL